jgi:hypothetical protein
MPCHLNETQRLQNEEMKSHGFKDETRRNPSVKKATQCKSHIHDHSLPSFHLSKNRKKPEKKKRKETKKKPGAAAENRMQTCLNDFRGSVLFCKHMAINLGLDEKPKATETDNRHKPG